MLFLLQAFPAFSEDTATQSLYSEDVYKEQRSCAQYCFQDCCRDFIGHDVLSCSNPILSSCYCRSYLQSVAVSAISSCVKTGCSSDTVDIQSVTSIYQAYCTSNGYVAAATMTSAYSPSATQAQATVSMNDPPSAVTTSPVLVTETSVSYSNSNNSSPSTGESRYHLMIFALGLVALLGSRWQYSSAFILRNLH
jgi:hypothetical protein